MLKESSRSYPSLTNALCSRVSSSSSRVDIHARGN